MILFMLVAFRAAGFFIDQGFSFLPLFFGGGLFFRVLALLKGTKRSLAGKWMKSADIVPECS